MFNASYSNSPTALIVTDYSTYCVTQNSIEVFTTINYCDLKHCGVFKNKFAVSLPSNQAYSTWKYNTFYR